jgi:hypothetical protein
MFGAKAQIAAMEKGLEFELVMVAYDSQLGYSPKHPEVLRINPKRQVPVLVHGDLEPGAGAPVGAPVRRSLFSAHHSPHDEIQNTRVEKGLALRWL